MRPSLSTWWILAAWILFVGSYAGVSLLLRPGPGLTTYGDLAQCVVPLFANAGLLLNAGSSNWRRNSFWMLMALGCTLWMVAQLLWTYFEIYLHQPVPNPFTGDFIFFLHTVPMIAALALEPHKRQPEPGLRFGYLDRKSTRLNSSHLVISYAVFCLKKKKKTLSVRVHPWIARGPNEQSPHARQPPESKRHDGQ